MVNKNEKSRWDFIGREPEHNEEREFEKEAEIEKRSTRPEDYPKEQLWVFYEELPEDLKKAVFSEEAGQICRNLAQKHGVPSQETKLTELLGYHLLGILPCNEFKDRLEQDFQIGPEASEALFRDVDEIILDPVRQSLDELYEK